MELNFKFTLKRIANWASHLPLLALIALIVSNAYISRYWIIKLIYNISTPKSTTKFHSICIFFEIKVNKSLPTAKQNVLGGFNEWVICLGILITVVNTICFLHSNAIIKTVLFLFRWKLCSHVASSLSRILMSIIYKYVCNYIDWSNKNN